MLTPQELNQVDKILDVLISSTPNETTNQGLFKIEEIKEEEEVKQETIPKKPLDKRFEDIFNVEEAAIRELLDESPEVNKLFDFDAGSDSGEENNQGLIMDKLFTEIAKEAKKIED